MRRLVDSFLEGRIDNKDIGAKLKSELLPLKEEIERGYKETIKRGEVIPIYKSDVADLA